MTNHLADPRTGAVVRPHTHDFRGPDGTCIAAPGCGATGVYSPPPTKIDRAAAATARCERHVGEPFPPRCRDCEQAAADADVVETTTCPAHGMPQPCEACRFATTKPTPSERTTP